MEELVTEEVVIEELVTEEVIVPEYTGARYLINDQGTFIIRDDDNRISKYTTVEPLESKEDHYVKWNEELQEWYYEEYPDAWAGTQPAIYTSLSPRQARLVLLKYELLDDVEAAVATNRVYSIYWEYALEINRYDETLLTMTSVLGISDSQLDALFAEGVLL